MITQPQPFQTFILLRKILMSFKMLLPNNIIEKIRMLQTYIEKPQADSPVFLEVKSKRWRIGHKFRLVATSQAIIQLDDRWESRSSDARSRLSARDSEIAQTL